MPSEGGTFMPLRMCGAFRNGGASDAESGMRGVGCKFRGVECGSQEWRGVQKCSNPRQSSFWGSPSRSHVSSFPATMRPMG